MRLFVAVWPPPAVVERLAALARPDVPGLRWTGPDQWHVTLRFLGSQDLDGILPQFDRVEIHLHPREAVLGPSTGRFGRRIVHVPVSGLDDLAAAVRPLPSGERADRPFVGHITLARARDQRGVDHRCLVSIVDAPFAASFPVTEVTLVASHLGRGPARYEVVARRPTIGA
jgi:2'-5' RNA ligase